MWSKIERFLWVVGCLAVWASLPCRGYGQALQASIVLNRSGNVWSYVINNQEPDATGNQITSFYLPISAPVSNVGTPSGWSVETDNATFIFWSNVELAPYSEDIAESTSLSGFEFESAAQDSNVNYELTSWNHFADQPGTTSQGTLLSPKAVYGDFNGDQTVDSQDLMLGIQFLVGLQIPTDTQLSMGDVRPYPGINQTLGNRQFTVEDINWILRRFLGLVVDPRS